MRSGRAVLLSCCVALWLAFACPQSAAAAAPSSSSKSFIKASPKNRFHSANVGAVERELTDIKPLQIKHVNDGPTLPTCQTDNDCPRSYCLNTPPHQPPFHCQSDPDLVCPPWPIKDLVCQHGGSRQATGCTVNSDCPEGYCLNYAPHIPPYVCQSYSHPICTCECVSNWIGPECSVWNSTTPKPGPNNNNNKIINYLNMLAAKERSMLASNQYLNPLTGWVGFGFDITTGEVRLPVTFQSYQDANRTFNGQRLPVQAKFTPYVQPGSNPPPASQTTSSSFAFPGLKEYRSELESSQQQLLSSTGSMFGALRLSDESTMPGMQKSYFDGDLALGVAQQKFFVYEMELSGPQSLQRMAELALISMPPSYETASEKAAYQTLIKQWGTHYTQRVRSGGGLEAVSKWVYSIYRHSGMSTSEISAQVALDLQNLSGLGPDGTPAGHASLNPTYATGRQLNPLTCYGGNPEACSAAHIEEWLKSIVEDAQPVEVSLLPISNLITDAGIKANVEAAINEYIAESKSGWDSTDTCPRCVRGSCSAGNEACSCPSSQAWGRLCDICLKGYGGPDCTTPQCSQGCNALHGHCVAPNQCKCDSGYQGPACMQPVPQCFEGSSTVLRQDNTVVPLTDVKVGDVVQTIDSDGKPAWSDVYYIRTTKDDLSPVDLVELEVTSASEGDAVRTLRLTSDHVVYATDSWSPAAGPSGKHEVMAGDVAVGMYMWVHKSSSGELGLERVSGARIVERKERLVSIHTLNGPVVVNGVAASSYDGSTTLRWIQNLESRVLYQLFPEFVANSKAYASYQDAFDTYVNEPILNLCLSLANMFSEVSSAATRAVSTLLSVEAGPSL